MDTSADLQDAVREAIENGLKDENTDTVAKFTGHALAYLRMFPPDDPEESILAGPKKGALAGYEARGSA